MSAPLILASGSSIRARLLGNAGIEFVVDTPRVDEAAVKAALVHEGAGPRDVADALAELKASRVAARHPRHWVLGSDQVLSFAGEVMSKPESKDEAMEQLGRLQGQTHQLLSAAVLFEDGQPIWRHVGVARLTMRPLSRDFIREYVDTYWDEIRHCVGAFRIEEEGVRLFSRIDGDYYSILGLPLLELQAFLALRGKVRL